MCYENRTTSKATDIDAHQAPTAEPASMEDYGAWKSRCGALLMRQGISAGVMREKEWCKLFIQSATPEDAARHAEVFYHNTRPALERTRKR
jgi:hypothetical protein